MDIQLTYIDKVASKYDVIRAIATILHGEVFVKAHCPNFTRPVNFEVLLDPDLVPSSIRNAGTGLLTLPTKQLGIDFLNFLAKRKIKIKVNQKPLRLRAATTDPQPRLVRILKKVPFQDPGIVEAKERLSKALGYPIPVRFLQIGIFFNKPPGIVFSPEWEDDYTQGGDGRLSFEFGRKLLRLQIGDHTENITRSVIVTFLNLKRIYMGWEMGRPFILFHLASPPAFEWEEKYRPITGYKEDNENIRHRLSYFDEGHQRVAPYAHQVRLVLKEDDLQAFSSMCQKAELPLPNMLRDGLVDVQRLHIFSAKNLDNISRWLKTLDWPVAFQLEALIRNLRLNALELWGLKPRVTKLIQERGPTVSRQILRHFHTVLRSKRPQSDTAVAALERTIKEYEILRVTKRERSNTAFFEAHHVSFTPTAMRLEGPYNHQSNRVLRQYLEHQEYFIRVDFRDEDRLQYRWDREVDGADFVRERVGGILHYGFEIAGRYFEFLGYSQSQLRAHSMFAVSPFYHPEKGLVTAASIRAELGIFDDILHFPALYAARVSQAFSGTEDSVSLTPDQWDEMEDIKHNCRCFTDGVGTISTDLATLVWEELCEQRGKTHDGPFVPVAFQIRFGGYKGMVVVDPSLIGIRMRLRPSMRKFHVHDSPSIPLEISRAFEYPGRMYLNRPLIQILEDLGVRRSVFMDLQSAAVTDVQTARNSLYNFASFLDGHALGRSYFLSYVIRSLDSIGCELEHHDPTRAVGGPFVMGLIDTGILSVLRGIKHNARIPVPKSWNLVGVADETDELAPGQIYVCIWERGAKEPFFLEGPVMISRSPTVHPGDVQMVTAIGKPPAWSSYEINPLPNVVVFSAKGKRDIPSCLGGGDLDGDLYLVCQFPDLCLPFESIHEPGDYPPTERKNIGRPSTIEDVADFVVEYINSDMVGLLSTNHLILSDQSSFGVRDRDCLKLAELCSKAVDYPKSGIPVDMKDTPRFLIPYKPDWKSDEDLNPRQTDYYESTRAIGYLFRAIKLEDNTEELAFDPRLATLKEKSKPVPPPPPPVEAISLTLEPIVASYLKGVQNPGACDSIPSLFSRYCLELKYICLTHTLSHDPDARLREEEVVIGTILAKCTQARWRRDRMEQMRINAGQLVQSIAAELKAPVDTREKLAMGWEAWKYSRANTTEYGHLSFGLIALEGIFKSLELLRGDEVTI